MQLVVMNLLVMVGSIVGLIATIHLGIAAAHYLGVIDGPQASPAQLTRYVLTLAGSLGLCSILAWRIRSDAGY